MVSDTLVLTVIYDRARTVLELINMETQWPEQGIGFVFPLAVLPLSVIFFHCHSASDFVLRLLPSLCNMAAAASSITPHTTVYKARKENIFFFFFFLREETSKVYNKWEIPVLQEKHLGIEQKTLSKQPVRQVSDLHFAKNQATVNKDLYRI